MNGTGYFLLVYILFWFVSSCLVLSSLLFFSFLFLWFGLVSHYNEPKIVAKIHPMSG